MNKPALRKQKTIDFTTGSIMPSLIWFAAPIIVGNLFQQLYNAVDTIILGRFAGVLDLAAVGSVGSVIFFVNTLAISIGNGCAIVVAQCFGEENYPKLRKTICISAMCIAFFGSLLAVMGIAFGKTFLLLLDTPQELIEGAYLYLVFMMVGILITAGYGLVSGVLRAVGDSRTPLYVLAFSCIVNIVLDLVFVIIFSWGIAGVATATLIAQFLSIVLCVSIIYRIYPKLRLTREDTRWDWGLTVTVLRLALPMTLQLAMTSSGFMFMQGAINSFGAIVVAGYSVAAKADQLFSTVLFALGGVAATFSAQNTGAKTFHRLQDGVCRILLICIGFSAVFCVIVWVYGGSILKIFVEPTETQVIAVGVGYLRCVSPFFALVGAMHIYGNALRGMNCSSVPLVGGVIEIAVRFAIAFLATAIFHNYLLIWFAGPIAWLITDPMLALKFRMLCKEKVLTEHNEQITASQ